MSWIEYHQELWDHRKVRRLATELQISYPQALGHLSCLWCYCAGQAKNGNLRRFSASEIGHATRYEGDADTLVAALKNSELLDRDNQVHDWKLHGLRLLKLSRNRVRRHRKRYSNVPVTLTPERKKEGKKDRKKERITSLEKGEREREKQDGKTKTTFDECLQDHAFCDTLNNAYPTLRLEDEVRKMRAWMSANPHRAVKRNYKRFIQGWMQREATQQEVSHDGRGTPTSQRRIAQETRRAPSGTDAEQAERHRRLDAITEHVAGWTPTLPTPTP